MTDTAPLPVIGITAYSARATWGAWDAEAVLLPRPYVAAVARAGAVPVVLPPLPDVVAGALPRIDGLIVAGGPDVEPVHYGETPGPHTQEPNRDRDASELVLLRRAIDAGMPVLGICRGMQLLNVLRGGTLHQHLPDVVHTEAHAPEVGAYATHPVSVKPGTRLAEVLGRTELDEVPTYHHQGIDVIGTGLQPTAWAPDGTLEAVEDPELPFCLGVQWHPEAGRDPSLFEGLVAAVRGAAGAAGRVR
jgi:putative glutamine amidotransferase